MNHSANGLAMRAKPPNDKAMKRFMHVAHDVRHDPNNSFFISREAGEILSSSWRRDNDHFGEVPSDRYEIHIKKNAKLTWDELYEQVDKMVPKEAQRRSDIDILCGIKEDYKTMVEFGIIDSIPEDVMDLLGRLINERM